MTTIPNLPPLPKLFSDLPTRYRTEAEAYALAAYQAGREAGLKEAADFVRGRRAGRNEGSDLWLEIGKIEHGIAALKSKQGGA